MSDVPTLTTPRFTMRPLKRRDEAAMFPTLSDEEQCRYLTRPAFESEQELWEWFADSTWDGRTWMAVDAAGEVVGRFVAVPGHGSDAAHGSVFEIGYMVAMHRQREGIARECSEALIAQLWAEGARKLTAEVDTRNAPSVRLLERLGFTREAHLREHDATHIGMCDVYWYSKLRSD
ncbi:MAG: GNAT family protein [Pseudomonadota bacterium]